MKRWMLGLGLVLAVALAGCIDDSGYNSGPAYEGSLSCRQFKTCGSCTLILGCGWCSIGDTGVCASEPNACWRATSFAWTWEANFCPAEVDGGAAPDRPDAEVGAAGDGNASGDGRATDAD